MHAGGQLSATGRSIIKGLCPDTSCLLIQTQLAGLWGSLPWEAAQRALESAHPALGPELPPPARPFVHSSRCTQPAHWGLPPQTWGRRKEIVLIMAPLPVWSWTSLPAP